MKKVANPESRSKILVDGPTYKRLLKSGKYNRNYDHSLSPICKFTDLPDELVEHITQFTSIRDLHNLLYTSKQTHQILKPLYKYKLSQIRNIKLSCGVNHGFYTIKDQIYGYGNNSFHQIHPELNIKTPIKLNHDYKVKEIMAGDQSTVVITDEGKVVISGYIQKTNMLVIEFPVKIIQAGLGNIFLMALGEDGCVYSCGYNFYGQLGLGHNSLQSQPVKLPNLSNIKQIAVGREHCVAINDKNEVYTWGYNAFGQLGHGDYISTNLPTLVVGLRAVSASCGDIFTLFLGEDGWAYGCGNSEYDEKYKFGKTPVKFINNVAKVSCGAHHSLILMKSGKVECIGDKVDINVEDVVNVAAGGKLSMMVDKWGNIYALETRMKKLIINENVE